jgi:hypothetical protein
VIDLQHEAYQQKAARDRQPMKCAGQSACPRVSALAPACDEALVPSVKAALEFHADRIEQARELTVVADEQDDLHDFLGTAT